LLCNDASVHLPYKNLLQEKYLIWAIYEFAKVMFFFNKQYSFLKKHAKNYHFFT